MSRDIWKDSGLPTAAAVGAETTANFNGYMMVRFLNLQ